jgi:chromosomal replication initiation ATPase DnaA
LKDAVGKVLLGRPEWVEQMRQMLGLSKADPDITELRHLVWRPSQEQIESVVASAFGVDKSELFAKRVRNNDATAAALYLIRKLYGVSATQLAQQYGRVSQAAISKTVQRAGNRREKERRWSQRLSCLEKSLGLEG